MQGRHGLTALFALAAGLASSTALAAADGGFHLDRLPVGKNVTIPKPATTYVPASARVVLTATDMPQSLSFVPVNLRNGGPVGTLKLAIYDRDSERVKYVELRPGTPFLYTFKELSSITVIPQPAAGQDAGIALKVESNKPLEIAH